MVLLLSLLLPILLPLVSGLRWLGCADSGYTLASEDLILPVMPTEHGFPDLAGCVSACQGLEKIEAYYRADGTCVCGDNTYPKRLQYAAVTVGPDGACPSDTFTAYFITDRVFDFVRCYSDGPYQRRLEDRYEKSSARCLMDCTYSESGSNAAVWKVSDMPAGIRCLCYSNPTFLAKDRATCSRDTWYAYGTITETDHIGGKTTSAVAGSVVDVVQSGIKSANGSTAAVVTKDRRSSRLWKSRLSGGGA